MDFTTAHALVRTLVGIHGFLQTLTLVPGFLGSTCLLQQLLPAFTVYSHDDHDFMFWENTQLQEVSLNIGGTTLSGSG